jgi:molybdopterin-dependent oxidoreductase alpha subunit
MHDSDHYEPYEGPAGGWGSVQSLTHYALEEGHVLKNSAILARQNKPDGFACVSCAWAKPADPHPAEFCENGAKATFWELTKKRNTPEFFAKHTATELQTWPDHNLEAEGRLTHPMRFNHETDRYEPTSWGKAFAEIGRELSAIRADDPKKAVFYASGRASLETSYMYALMARIYGNNNLPDSSNMCHESTSVALPKSIGVAVGTVRLDDFEKTDAIFFFGQNVGSNSPRMLHDLQEASKRGVPIVSFNPLRERGLERFTNPQSPIEMATGSETRISSEYYQVKAGGDIAAITGICKALLEMDAEALGAGKPSLLDHAFLSEHTHGSGEFLDYVKASDWNELERHSGLTREALSRAAATYAKAERVIGVYGMGLTQHKLGVTTVRLLTNLLLLRGNIGKEGAGICPVRGHSNVQGQRTVGISEKPELVPLDKLKELYHFEPPTETGYSTVDACGAIIREEVRAFVGLGGNFLRAVPERELMERAWPRMRLTVQIATKLNRSHLFNGDVAYLLPCLGRIEIDEQASGTQVVTMEDSTSCIHASRGFAQPASDHLLSEPRIVAELAKATLPDAIHVPWNAWVDDYSKIRDAIEATYPDIFKDFNARMFQPGGFPKPLAARHRKWNTETGKANFVVPEALSASFQTDTAPDVLRLITLRSNDQFNTTVYGYSDRFRGINGTRMVVMMNTLDMERLDIQNGEIVAMEAEANDGVPRRMEGFEVINYNIPSGCVGAYYPECNALIPLWQHADESKVPAAKSVPVRVLKMQTTQSAEPLPA